MTISKEWLKKTPLDKLEKLCLIDLSANEDAFQEQKEIAGYLAKKFSGGKRAAPNHSKAYKYHCQATGEEPTHETTMGAAQSAYTFSYWFNFVRLLGVRIGMIAEYFGKSLLPKAYGIAGFIYIADFIIDAGDVLTTTFKPAATKREQKLSYWALRKERFLNALGDGRAQRMENAFVWGILNVVTFFVFGLPGLILTFCGYGHDFVAEVLFGGKEYLLTKSLLEEKQADLVQPRKELAKLNDLENACVSNQGKIQALNREIAKLECYENALENEIKSVKLKRAFLIGNTSATLLGCAFIVSQIPPLQVIGLILLIGGIAGNIAEKSWETYKFFKPTKPPVTINKKIGKEEETELQEEVRLGSSYKDALSPLLPKTTTAIHEVSETSKIELGIDLAAMENTDSIKRYNSPGLWSRIVNCFSPKAPSVKESHEAEKSKGLFLYS